MVAGARGVPCRCFLGLAFASLAVAAPVTKTERLFRIGVGGQTRGTFAADPTTGHLFFYDTQAGNQPFGGHKIDEYTPWGEFVRAFGADVAPGAVNETQELRVRASHGAFKLTFGASTTPDLPFDASGEEVRAALDGLSSIGEAGGSVDVNGRVGSLDGSTPYIYVITFRARSPRTTSPNSVSRAAPKRSVVAVRDRA